MSSTSSSHPSFNKILTIEEQVSYILGKRKREEMTDSSIIGWKQEWDDEFIKLLDQVCSRDFESLRYFNLGLWRKFADMLALRLGIPRHEFPDGNACIKKAEELKKECLHNEKDKCGSIKIERQSILKRIFYRINPQFPKEDAGRLHNTVEAMLERVENETYEGSTSNTNRRSRRSRRWGSSSTSRRSSSSSFPEWKITLVKDVNILILKHDLRFELMGQICNKFDQWMAIGFHMMEPPDQMQQIRRLMAADGENNITSSDANSTQPLPFSSSAD